MHPLSAKPSSKLLPVTIGVIAVTWVSGFLMLSSSTDEVLGPGRLGSWISGSGILVGLIIALTIAQWADRRAERDPSETDEAHDAPFLLLFLGLFVVVGGFILTQGGAMLLNSLRHGPRIEREVEILSKSVRTHKNGTVTWILRLGTGPADPLRFRAVPQPQFDQADPGKTRFAFQYCEGALGMPVLLGWQLIDPPSGALQLTAPAP